MPRRQNSKPSFAGIFSGCGGFDLGFQQAGFQCIAAYDCDPIANATHNLNIGGKAVNADLSTVTALDLTNAPDVIVAGPPCQGFSTLGLRKKNDPRNSLLTHAAHLAVDSAPKVIVIENVSGVIAGEHNSYWNKAKQIVEGAGYSTREFHVLGTDFGLPQIRKRIILLAARCNLDKIQLPKAKGLVALQNFFSGVESLPNHSPRILKPSSIEYRIAQRIKPHQKLCNVRGGERSVPTWDIPDVFGEVTSAEKKILNLIQRLRRQIRSRDVGDADPISLKDLRSYYGRDPSQVVKSLRRKGYLRDIGRRIDLSHTFNGKFRRLSWDHPAPAVDTRFGQPRYYLHPEEHRGLSVREAARIQGFPDDFIFQSTLTDQYRMIGNAVSPCIGRWFGHAILQHLL